MTGKYKTLKDIPIEENLVPGSMLCSGCGGILLVRLFEKILGPIVVTVNAAGCMSLLSVFPYTPFRSSWFYSSMPGAPAAAQGIRDALDLLIKKGKISEEDNLKVVVLTGDGAAADIGLQSTSGALYRNLDFYYLVYDNEGYSNTGFQASSSSPYGSATKTSLPTNAIPQGNLLAKKDLFEIWNAHRPPYVATISLASIGDMMRKIEKASQYADPKLFIAHSPCPPGWDINSDMVIRIAKTAIETGIWTLKESIYGDVTHSVMVHKRRSVEEYLKMQGRFEHLFKPVRQDSVIQVLQKRVDDYWAAVRK